METQPASKAQPGLQRVKVNLSTEFRKYLETNHDFTLGNITDAQTVRNLGHQPQTHKFIHANHQHLWLLSPIILTIIKLVEGQLPNNCEHVCFSIHLAG